MKKSLLENSIRVVLCIMLLIWTACIAKHQSPIGNQKEVSTSEKPKVNYADSIQSNGTTIVHTPGTINQGELDSVKAAQRALKRRKIYNK